MRIESLKLKNFKCFRNVEFKDIPRFCVLVGANGAGKSTLFNVFTYRENKISVHFQGEPGGDYPPPVSCQPGQG